MRKIFYTYYIYYPIFYPMNKNYFFKYCPVRIEEKHSLYLDNFNSEFFLTKN